MGLYSQNRLVNISENAQEYAEIFEFYNNIKVDQNTPSIHEVCMMAANLHFATESFDQLLTESVFLEADGDKLIDTDGMAKAKAEQKAKDAPKPEPPKPGETDKPEEKTEDKAEGGDKKEKKKDKKVNKEGLLAKIANLFHKFTEAIVKVFENITKKLTPLKEIDLQKLSKYKKYIKEWDKYKDGFKGVAVDPDIAALVLSKENNNEANIDVEVLTVTGNLAKEYIKKIGNAGDVEEVRALTNEFKVKAKEDKAVNKANKVVDKAMKKDENASFQPTQEQLDIAWVYIETGLDGCLKEVAALKDRTVNVFKDLETTAKSELKKTKEGNDELDTAIAKAKFDIYRVVSSKIGRDFSVMTNATTRGYIIARKCIVSCGKYAREKVKANNEGYEFDEYVANLEAFEFGEASDMFLESVFDFEPTNEGFDAKKFIKDEPKKPVMDSKKFIKKDKPVEDSKEKESEQNESTEFSWFE